jgi:beta-mannosidase
MRATSLNGTWQLLPVAEFKERYPDEGWLEMEVPSHWQQHPQMESRSGKVVYRRSFSFRKSRGKRYRLRLNGVFYRSMVYLNGQRLGENEGYFFAHDYEVTGFLKQENAVQVEVDCPDEEDKANKRLVTGVFSHWDALDPQANPGGIWLPVEIVESGDIYIKERQLRLEDVGDDVATASATLVVDAATPGLAEVRVSFTPFNFEGAEQSFVREVELDRGLNEVSMPLTVHDPRLWWTHDQGFPHLYRVALQVKAAGGRVASDMVEFNYGLRTFEMRDWVAYLNGRRVFLKGNNYGPGDTRPATMNPERFRQDLELARQAHMNMLRVHAHVEHPAFYELADEMGILLWQDFPLQWNYSKEVLPEALRQAELMVRRLYDHPSVVIWCMHNEPGILPEPSGWRLAWTLKTLFALGVYNWNKDVMDRKLKRRVQELDDSRVVVRSSGEWAVRLLRKGTDSHLYYGWYRDKSPSKGLESSSRALRFVTEFGTQSFPNYESSIKFMSPDLSGIDWKHLEVRHSLQRRTMDRWLDLDSFDDLKGLIEASQEYQIAVNQQYVDRLRCHKYRPTGGVLAFCFHDPNPAVQWSVVDYWRVPKRSYYHLQRAFHPEYVFTLLKKEKFAAGEEIEVPIYVVNDTQRSYDEVAVSAEVFNDEGKRTTSAAFTAALPADSQAELVQALSLRFSQPGKRRLVLRLEYEGEVFENPYDLVITPA